MTTAIIALPFTSLMKRGRPRGGIGYLSPIPKPISMLLDPSLRFCIYDHILAKNGLAGKVLIEDRVTGRKPHSMYSWCYARSWKFLWLKRDVNQIKIDRYYMSSFSDKLRHIDSTTLSLINGWTSLSLPDDDWELLVNVTARIHKDLLDREIEFLLRQ